MMKWVQAIGQYLQHPFPQEESIGGMVKMAGGISVFVTMFLYVYRPGGFHDFESNLFLVCLGFGAVCFLTSLIYELLMVRVFKFKGGGAQFTFGRWIIYIIGMILFISIANFLYVRLAVFGYIMWEFLPHMIRGTLSVAVFPIIILGGWAMYQQERKYRHIATGINQQPIETPVAPSTKQEVSIMGIPISRIRYIEALQNYVRVAYVDDQLALNMHTERATLKGILDQVEGDVIARSHRSYLVNRNSILSAEGNAQGLLLTLSDCDVQVPVSRSYVKAFRK